MDIHGRPKDVRVRAYSRIRYGRQEHITAHWRSHPRQYVLNF